MSYDPVQILTERFKAGIAAAFPQLGPDVDPLIAPSKQAALGDYQSNAAMSLAKRLGLSPRDAAKAIVAATKIDDVAEALSEASIAGPGFINVRLRADALSHAVLALDTPTLGVEPPASPSTVVVDLCGVNLAKQMHVGHLRSAVIGDAIARTLERLGHAVVRQNHVGDWGLPIAMVTDKLMREAAAGRVDLALITLDDLDRLYKAAQREADADTRGLAAVRRFGLGPKAAAELEAQVAGAEERMAGAKRTLVALQSHEPRAYAVWERIAQVTMDACLATMARLRVSVRPEHSAGESSYAGELAPLVEDLMARGIAEVSDGAVIVRLDMEPYRIAEPAIVRKRDGGFLYATTDMAAIRRRVQKIGAERVIYAVDARQGLHFKQVYAAADRAGYDVNPRGVRASLEHAAFGTVLGEDGRPFKTRSGENVRLSDLIDEAVRRAEAVVTEKSPHLEAAERRAIGEAVGVAALKYADLSSDRVKDYVFSFDRMLAFEGNSGPYLLLALVRVKSIFRKAAERGLAAGWESAPLRLDAPAEKTLGLALLRYPGVLRSVADALEPHRLCGYLYDLAGAFSGFFENCPVLAAPDEATRLSRLRLCDLTARVLADGLHALGIPTLERM